MMYAFWKYTESPDGFTVVEAFLAHLDKVIESNKISPCVNVKFEFFFSVKRESPKNWAWIRELAKNFAWMRESGGDWESL